MKKRTQIREITEKDIPKLKEIESKCFDKSVNENFKFALENGYVYICYISEDKIVGYAGASVSFEQSDISYICVLQEYRNQKIASILLEKLIDILRSKNIEIIFLEVNEKNIPAINLYKKFGFRQINTRKNYYGKDSALIMIKELK